MFYFDFTFNRYNKKHAKLEFTLPITTVFVLSKVNDKEMILMNSIIHFPQSMLSSPPEPMDESLTLKPAYNFTLPFLSDTLPGSATLKDLRSAAGNFVLFIYI